MQLLSSRYNIPSEGMWLRGAKAVVNGDPSRLLSAHPWYQVSVCSVHTAPTLLPFLSLYTVYVWLWLFCPLLSFCVLNKGWLSGGFLHILECHLVVRSLLGVAVML